jgi:hypothetical protein
MVLTSRDGIDLEVMEIGTLPETAREVVVGDRGGDRNRVPQGISVARIF